MIRFSIALPLWFVLAACTPRPPAGRDAAPPLDEQALHRLEVFKKLHDELAQSEARLRPAEAFEYSPGSVERPAPSTGAEEMREIREEIDQWNKEMGGVGEVMRRGLEIRDFHLWRLKKAGPDAPPDLIRDVQDQDCADADALLLSLLQTGRPPQIQACFFVLRRHWSHGDADAKLVAAVDEHASDPALGAEAVFTLWAAGIWRDGPQGTRASLLKLAGSAESEELRQELHDLPCCDPIAKVKAKGTGGCKCGSTRPPR
jgi:hypothetical protein